MARQTRKGTTTPVSANLDLRAMQMAIPRLNKRIAELEEFDPNAVNSSTEAAHITDSLSASILDTLTLTFGHGTVEYDRYQSAGHFYIPYTMFEETPLHEIRNALKNSKNSNIGLLRTAVKTLEERVEEEKLVQTTQGEIAPAKTVVNSSNRKIFIVHGHDDGVRESVARFLEKLGFETVILHEQANRGKTIIEKFEVNADVGFAVVLLTADDVGGVSSDVLQSRARQNVILELGYFIGRLGRDRVCALKSGNVEIPSDIIGVGYTPYDGAGAWKTALGKELKAAEYDIDWNIVMN